MSTVNIWIIVDTNWRQFSNDNFCLIRVLAEEWERREELERLQEEQNKMLEEERLKRQQFEMLQAEKEAQYKGMQLSHFLWLLILKSEVLADGYKFVLNVSFAFLTEAEKRLKELEEEKQRLDAELKAAQHKISKTEHTAHALQVQLRVSINFN